MITFLLAAVLGLPQKGLEAHGSHLNKGPSDLLNRCYLLQGLPNRTVGAEFTYDKSASRDFEDFLYSQMNNSPTKARVPLTDILWFLSNNVYEVNGHMAIAMTEESRKRSLDSIKYQLSIGQRPPRIEIIARAEIFYLSFKPHSRNNDKLIRDVEAIDSPAAKIVGRNLRKVSRKLIFADNPGKDWKKVEIWR